MKFRIILAAVALCSTAFGMSKKPSLTVRFHPEANQNDGPSFVMPIKLENMRRNAYVARVPAFSERQIKEIYPFPADDGTYGCVFRLDDQGKIRLETMSSEQMNTALVLFVGTKSGQHQVIDMLIDRPVTTGMITVPRGLTAAEVAVMKQQFKIIGEEPKKKKKEPKPDDPTDWRMDRTRDQQSGTGAAAERKPGDLPVTQPPVRTGVKPVPREQLRELDLPRVAD
jgi:hypothetical protein